MLSKKDREFVRQAIREEIRTALTVKVRMERRRDVKTGQPLAAPELEVKDVFLPDFWVEYLPYYEAAVRGVQETADRVKNNVATNNAAIQAMGKIMVGFEQSMLKIANFANMLPEKPPAESHLIDFGKVVSEHYNNME